MLILGIDPGKATTGYALVEFSGQGLSLLDFGWIKTDKDSETGERLILIEREIGSLISHHQPDVLSLERLFFFANAKTVMGVSEAMGVIKLAAAKKKIPVVEYAPLQIKLVVTGNGRADKQAIKKAVRRAVKIRCPKKKKTYFDDVADAVAVAICHAKKIGVANDY